MDLADSEKFFIIFLINNPLKSVFYEVVVDQQYFEPCLSEYICYYCKVVLFLDGTEGNDTILLLNLSKTDSYQNVLMARL